MYVHNYACDMIVRLQVSVTKLGNPRAHLSSYGRFSVTKLGKLTNVANIRIELYFVELTLALSRTRVYLMLVHLHKFSNNAEVLVELGEIHTLYVVNHER